MTVTTDYALAPDGYSRTTLLSGNAILFQFIQIEIPGDYIFSIFAKPNNRDLIVKLGNETAGLQDSTPLPNGWRELKVTASLPYGEALCQIQLGDGAGGVEIFGASLTTLADAGAYIPDGTITDYTLSPPDYVTFGSTPMVGDKLLWTGSYQYERSLVSKTVMSQYANSPRILSMIDALGDALDLSQLNRDFYDMVVNLRTAEGYGLDIWGRIVGVSREVNITDPEGKYFGFSDGFYPFNEHPFSSGGQNADTWALTDHAYRDLIFLKAISNIVYATAPNINALLRYAFRGSSYFLLHNNMTASYVFEFFLSPFERHIVYNTDILPRPCGVEINYIEQDPSQTFGFYGTEFAPFNQGVFAT